MKQSLITDLQPLTQLSGNVFSKLIYLSELSICDDINELDMSSDNILELDIGIGKICFLITEDSLQYQFIPSKSLENSIIKTLETKSNPLVTSTETSLETKILKTYKELL